MRLVVMILSWNIISMNILVRVGSLLKEQSGGKLRVEPVNNQS